MRAVDELLILIEKDGAQAATVADGVVQDLRRETGDGRGRPGAIHLGRVIRDDRGLDASFIDLGLGEPGLMNTPGSGPAAGKAVLAQIVQAASKGKGPRLSLRMRFDGIHLSLTARGNTLVDESNVGPGISWRFMPDGVSDEAIRAEAEALVAEHAAVMRARHGRQPVAVLWHEPDPAARLVRTFAALRPQRILVSDRLAAERLRRRLSGAVAPLAERVAAAPDGAQLFDRPEVDAAINEAGARSLALPGGGRITIDAAQAATIIDVDTGGTTGGPRLFAQVNEAAARAIARQIRLRDLTGVIVIDFIGVGDRRGGRDVEAALSRAASGDPRPVETLGFTRAGLYEVVRSDAWR